MFGHPDAFGLLKSIIDLSASSLSVRDKLDRMLESICAAFQADQCLLMRRDQIVENGFFSRLAAEKRTFWVDEDSSFSEEEFLPPERDLLRPAFACIPLHDGTTLQGIFYLGFSRKRKFSPQEIDLLVAIGEEIEEAIQHSHLDQKMEQAASELAALREMGKVATSTLKLDDLLESIINAGLKILKAKGGVLRIEDKKTKELNVRWSLGDYHHHPLDDKIARRVFYTQTPLLLNHSGEGTPPFSTLCAPLLAEGGVFGTLTFYDKEDDPPKFDRRDFEMLWTVANQMSNAIENALIHSETSQLAQENERRVRQLTTLWELNKALLTTVHLERILQMTLTAITIGDGLGFNRAMLFMVNEKTRSLEGTMAVGPDSAEEAGRIWNTLSRKKGTLVDLVSQMPPIRESDSALSGIVKNIKMPLDGDHCILLRTVLEGRPFNVRSPSDKEEWLQTQCDELCVLSSEVGCSVGEHLGRRPTAYSFATVPLWGKGKVIGVILVDNLFNGNPITDENLHFLNMFANQAGLAIENALLYRNLEEVHQELKTAQSHQIHREKMVALGEMSASVAHELKNPLVSIGGFARRLDRSQGLEGPEKRYAQTIVEEVTRLERILNDLLSYTWDETIAFKECDIQPILEESLSMVPGISDAGGPRIIREYGEEIPKVMGDAHQLKQAFYSLITNARDAMGEKGNLFLRVSTFLINDTPFVRVEVEDTGSGIDPEKLHHIFNPFYTTKEASLGLGLPIVHKIVTSHQGKIEVENHPGEGINFIITLPAAPEREGKEVDR
jgi:signal transduction histidine kinase